MAVVEESPRASQPSMPHWAFSQIFSMVVLEAIQQLVPDSTCLRHSPGSAEDHHQGGISRVSVSSAHPQCKTNCSAVGSPLRLQHQMGCVTKEGWACSSRQTSHVPWDLTWLHPVSTLFPFSLNVIKDRSSLSSEDMEHVPVCTSFQEQRFQMTTTSQCVKSWSQWCQDVSEPFTPGTNQEEPVPVITKLSHIRGKLISLLDASKLNINLTIVNTKMLIFRYFLAEVSKSEWN